MTITQTLLGDCNSYNTVPCTQPSKGTSCMVARIWRAALYTLAHASRRLSTTVAFHS